MLITPCTQEDLPVILALYDAARAYQRSKQYNVWPPFDLALTAAEVKEQRLYKIEIEGEIACIFSIVYNEPPIVWKDAEENTAIYLHRIATNPAFKGRRLLTPIIEWSRTHARDIHRSLIRMDTWADNDNLTAYYVGYGFKLLGTSYMPAEEAKAAGLPGHYWDNTANLFEMNI
ncbi:N-acetyltransferase [Chitinophaga vietnamensis]|uniref:GNAT family N-acetyltransferase n=1 Tax=Chitinophaga vietnamensis TaxID=2593957 RepID=UPI0011776D69|nr:GNAT family N-acetyltransferase [Chitinophaga vietnamensis]